MFASSQQQMSNSVTKRNSFDESNLHSRSQAPGETRSPILSKMLPALLLVVLIVACLSMIGDAFQTDLMLTETSAAKTKLDQEYLYSRSQSLGSRAKTLRAVADDLVEDARVLKGRTKELSDAADKLIQANTASTVASIMSSARSDDNTESSSSSLSNWPVVSETRKLRSICKSTECGVSCMKDCTTQCRVAKALELPIAGCWRDFCPRTCAVGCTAEPCSYKFVLVS